MKRLMLAAAISLPLVVANIGSTPAAQEEGAIVLTCYSVGFERTPSVGVKTNPIGVQVDDGDPYINKRPGSC
jgi:hypothetical protein